METKWFARAGAALFAGVVITVTTLEMRAAPAHPDTPPLGQAFGNPDPLRAELVRCQSIGQAGASDPICLRAWAENRRRFLAPGARPVERLPDVAPLAKNTLDAGGR